MPLGASRGRGSLASPSTPFSIRRLKNLLTPENTRRIGVRALAGETVDRTGYASSARPPRGPLSWIECGSRPLRRARPETFAERSFIFRDRTIADRKTANSRSSPPTSCAEFIYEGNLTGILHATVDGRIPSTATTPPSCACSAILPARKCRAFARPQLYVDPLAERERLVHLVSVSPDVREFEIAFRRPATIPGGLGSHQYPAALDPRPGQVGAAVLVSLVVDITDRKLWEDTLRNKASKGGSPLSCVTSPQRRIYQGLLNGKYLYYNEASGPLFNKRPGRYHPARPIEEKSGPSRMRRSTVRMTRPSIESGRPIEFMEPRHACRRHPYLAYVQIPHHGER